MQQFYSRNKNSNRITKDLGVSLHKFYRIGFSNVPLTVSSPQFLRNSRSPELARPLAVARIEKLVVVAVSSDACRSDVSRNDGNRGGTVCRSQITPSTSCYRAYGRVNTSARCSWSLSLVIVPVKKTRT